MGRIVVIALSLGVLLVATGEGERVMRMAQDFARTMVARFEMGSLKDAIVTDSAVRGTRPPAGDYEGFRDYVRDNLSAPAGRDASLDPWGSPYELLDLGGGDYVLTSLGPNGVQDAGCYGGSGSGTVDSLDRVPALEGDEDAVQLRDDDVCVWLKLLR